MSAPDPCISEKPVDAKAPAYSVVIITYNRAHFVPAAVRSVLDQTYKDFELILVDDGSRDGTREALKPFMDRIRYVHQENGGIAAARNRGIQEARGRWVSFLDSDDLWEPEVLEQVNAAFKKHPDVGFVALTAREMDEDGTVTDRVYGKRSQGEFYTTSSLLWGDSGVASWFTARRDLLQSVGPYDTAMHSADDCDLLVRISLSARMLNLSRPLMRYRVHGNNISKNRRKNARDWIRLLEKLQLSHPAWVAEHRWVYRRTMGKELLRYGRETLAQAEGNPADLSEARSILFRSIRTYPLFKRAWLYWAWSWLSPSTFAPWRQRQLEKRRLGQ